MTREALVEELKAMRGALDEAGVQVLQLDLEAKRASGDPDAAEVAAAYADDLRASLAAVARRAAFLARILASMRPPDGGG